MKRVPKYKNSVKSEAHAAARTAYTEKLQNQWAACEVRQEEAGKTPPEERLKILDARLGKGKGAQRERARLQKKIEAAKSAPKPTKKKAERAAEEAANAEAAQSE